MIRILFVDDNIERVQEIVDLLNKFEIVYDYDYAITKEDAIKKLSSKQFDLLFVDVVLPETIRNLGYSQMAGLEIVNEVYFGRNIIRPLFVIGITSNSESFDAVKNEFDDKFIPISIWKMDDAEWKRKVITKIKYISKITEEYKPINMNEVDVAIITAVDDEYCALDALPICWNDIRVPGDPLIYSKGMLGEKKSILRVKLPEMGMSASSHVTTRIIEVFEPKTVVMTGICGGNKAEVVLGDVIIAERSWDYGSGKIKKDKDGKLSFSALPNQICIDTNLRSDIERNTSVINEIFEEWNRNNTDNKSSDIKIGAITTGSAVVANSEIINSVIEPQYRKVYGIDMETYGVYFACQKSGRNIKFVSIKAVSDLADEEKDDSYHDYCSYASAKFALELIRRDVL